jgi:chromosome segregation ATPase
MQASRTNLTVAALVVLLAIVGWVMYASIQSRFDEQEARFAAERAELTGQIADLTGERERLTGQVTGLEQTLAQERAAAGDLASLRERIETTGASLNQRMAALGARERELAEVGTALDRATQEMAALEQRQGVNQQRLNARLATLGERERELAETARALGRTQLRAQEVRSKIEELDRTDTEKRTVLGALNLEIGTLDRQRAQRATALAGVQAELETTQARLVETRAQLDQALLAKSVAELQARETDLEAKLNDLDAELAHKGPLFDRSVDVSREIATLDAQLRSLTEQRVGLADELADLVTQIGQPPDGARGDARAAPNAASDEAKVAGN